MPMCAERNVDGPPALSCCSAGRFQNCGYGQRSAPLESVVHKNVSLSRARETRSSEQLSKGTTPFEVRFLDFLVGVETRFGLLVAFAGAEQETSGDEVCRFTPYHPHLLRDRRHPIPAIERVRDVVIFQNLEIAGV